MKRILTLVLWLCLIYSPGHTQTGETNIPDQPDADGRILKPNTNSWAFKDYMRYSDLSDYHHAPPDAVEAFKDMKYGIRIHWGIYSFFQGESWILKNRSPGVQTDESGPQGNEFNGFYHNIYKSWHPWAFDAKDWARMFKENGFRFFVFTTKHHDGFSMYDTRYKVSRTWDFFGEDAGRIIDCDLHYSIMETPLKRDVTGELIEACRKEGLKTGLYYSHPDWFDADFRYDPNSPFFDKSFTPEDDPEVWARFKERHSGQLKELLSNYGKVDMLSLDMVLEESTWPYIEQLMRELRPLQPDCMYRWRGIGLYGDYHTPESYIPGDEEMGNMPWQVIHPLSNRRNFSYEPDTSRLEDGVWIVENLVDIVSKGGNFMVGVGPDNTGVFHPAVLEALSYAGRWLDVNGEAIFATRPWTNYREGEEIRFTRSKDGKMLYAHAMSWPGEVFSSELVKPLKGSQVSLLGTDEALDWKMKDGKLWVSIPEELQLPENRPCEQVYVFKFHVK